jgi:hypothetical protein
MQEAAVRLLDAVYVSNLPHCRNGTYLSQHGGEDAGKYLKRNGGG